MIPRIATALCVVFVAGLFYLVRQPREQTSKALWLPVIWLLIGGSRNIGEWFHSGGPQNWDNRYLEGNPVDRAVLSFFLVLGLLVLFTRGKRIRALLKANLPIVLFFVYCGISIMWSEFPYVAFKRWNRALGDFVMVLIIMSDLNWIAALKKVFARTVFLLVPFSVVFNRYFPDLGRSFSKYEGRMFYTGVSTDKNGLGMICLVFGLGALWCFLSAYNELSGKERRRHFLAFGIILVLVTWLCYQSDSATSAACLGMCSVLMVVASFRFVAKRRLLVVVMALAVLFVPLYALFLDKGGNLVGSLGRDPTLTGRTAVWELVVTYVNDPLFGSGYESFWLGTRLESILRILPGLNQAHNGYIEIYLNLGWVGISALALVIVFGFRNVTAALRKDRHVGRLALAFLVMGLVYNLTEAGFKMMSPIWSMFLLGAMRIPWIGEGLRIDEAPAVFASEIDEGELESGPGQHLDNVTVQQEDY